FQAPWGQRRRGDALTGKRKGRLKRISEARQGGGARCACERRAAAASTGGTRAGTSAIRTLPGHGATVAGRSGLSDAPAQCPARQAVQCSCVGIAGVPGSPPRQIAKAGSGEVSGAAIATANVACSASA